jgi:threonine/homoserine/homoserine lactone efflux protein
LLPYVISGITFGLGAGLSPGPLLALLVAQTVRYGQREGLKVAVAPVLTDAPIVAVTLLILSRFSEVTAVLAVISIAGGLYLIWLGVESLRFQPIEVASGVAAPHSIRKAFMVNTLNPHVYIFWATVGAPIILRAAEASLATPVAFVAPFYVVLCGSKSVLAVLIHRSRAFLGGRAYLRTVQILGIVLLAFGLWLIQSGARDLLR